MKRKLARYSILYYSACYLTRKSFHKRNAGERKHTTDTERQLLLDYYAKFGTCTTVPEFAELFQELGWDAHRTKIWLYNRKTYHHSMAADYQYYLQK